MSLLIFRVIPQRFQKKDPSNLLKCENYWKHELKHLCLLDLEQQNMCNCTTMSVLYYMTDIFLVLLFIQSSDTHCQQSLVTCYINCKVKVIFVVSMRWKVITVGIIGLAITVFAIFCTDFYLTKLRENTLSNKTQSRRKSMNMGILVFGSLNQLFIGIS